VITKEIIIITIIPHHSKQVIPVRTLIKNSHNKLPEDDQDRSKHVGVMTNCLLKYNLNISTFIGYIV
jgi:hypothetical protein